MLTKEQTILLWARPSTCSWCKKPLKEEALEFVTGEIMPVNPDGFFFCSSKCQDEDSEWSTCRCDDCAENDVN